MELQLLVATTGIIRCVYSEVIELGELGQLTIRRASYVEPDGSGCWQVDLNPVGGPVLAPFLRRSEALAAEANWLTAGWLLAGCGHE